MSSVSPSWMSFLRYSTCALVPSIAALPATGQRERDPWRDAGADFVGVSDGGVVATLRVLARRIAGAHSELRMSGFGAVASEPAVRGQGYVRRLLALAHDSNRTAGYDV